MFHATGTGGQSFEALATGGFLVGRARRHDDRAGRRARRRRAVGRARTGWRRPAARASRRSSRSGALDMVNFGPRDTVPERFADRNLYVHNPTITLMRTTPRRDAPSWAAGSPRKLNGARRADACCSCRCAASRRSTSTGQPFHDAEADDGAVRGAARGHRRREGRGPRGRRRRQRPGVRRPRWPTGLHELIRGGADDRATRRCARLRAQVAAGRPIIGAGAGTGLSAKCAEAGGADLIIIYNSGRYRMAGRGSLAGHDALRRRQRDRHGHGARGAAGRARHAGARRASAAPTRSGSCRAFLEERQARGLHRRAELPDGRADRRHVPRRGWRRRGWATGSRSR